MLIFLEIGFDVGCHLLCIMIEVAIQGAYAGRNRRLLILKSVLRLIMIIYTFVCKCCLRKHLLIDLRFAAVHATGFLSIDSSSV